MIKDFTNTYAHPIVDQESVDFDKFDPTKLNRVKVGDKVLVFAWEGWFPGPMRYKLATLKSHWQIAEYVPEYCEFQVFQYTKKVRKGC